jgi:hypothetical protein
MGNQDNIENSPMGDMMAPGQGLTVPGEAISGPGVTNVKVPGPSKVPAAALPNPALQQAAMGNVGE